MHKVRISAGIKLFLKSVIIILIASFFVYKFNISEYMKFIPPDYQYETGLALYMAGIEFLYDFIESLIEQKKSTILCTFYTSPQDINIENTPLIICDDAIGVANINCHLKVSGNLKKIRKSVLNLELPSWLDAQINAQYTVLSYQQNELKWTFDRMLPTTSTKPFSAEYKCKISFMKNTIGDNMIIPLEPNIDKKCGIKFKTNGFKIQNGV